MWLLLASAALAQTPVDPFDEADESELFRFEEELVTVASRYAQTVRKAPSIVTLVSADEIRERGYRTVSEALRTLPGVYVWRSQEGRDLAAIRGVVAPDNNKLLVLVDGRPWYDGVYTHGFIDDYLPISNVRQIEVIKGPGSAIYGTNAFTGAVNIVTWRAQDLDGARVRVIGGGTTRGDVTVSAGGRGRVGNRPADATAYVRLFGQTGDGLDVAPDLDLDQVGTDPKKGLAAGAELTLGDLKLQVHHVDFAHTYLTNGRQGPFDALGRTVDTFDLQYHDTFLDARYEIPIGQSTLTPYSFYQRHDNPASYYFGGDISVDPVTLEATQFFRTVDPEKSTDRWGVGLDTELRPALDHVVVAGLGTEAVRVVRLFDLYTDSDGTVGIANNFQVTDDCGQPAGLYTDLPGQRQEACENPGLQNLFAYAQYTWTATPFLELTAGGRFDKRIPVNDAEKPTDGAFTPAFSPRLGVLLVPSDTVTAKLLYGRAFRAPNVRELLVKVDPDPATGEYDFASGNAQLRPEAINTTEGEVTADVAEGLTLRADGSWSLLVNEIDKVPPGLYCNLTTDLSIYGAEAGVRAEQGPIELGADYALTLAQYSDGKTPKKAGACELQATNAYAGLTQYEFPPHMGKGSLRWAFGDHTSMTVFGEVYSRRPRATWSPTANNPDGEAFALLHLAARAAELGPDGRVELGFALRNVLGTRWSHGVYRDDSDEDDVPGPITGDGRTATVAIEVAL